jgi:hypothetical protein
MDSTYLNIFRPSMRTDPLLEGDQKGEPSDCMTTHGADLIYQSFSCWKLSSPSRNMAISGPSPLESLISADPSGGNQPYLRGCLICLYATVNYTGASHVIQLILLIQVFPVDVFSSSLCDSEQERSSKEADQMILLHHAVPFPVLYLGVRFERLLLMARLTVIRQVLAAATVPGYG